MTPLKKFKMIYIYIHTHTVCIYICIYIYTYRNMTVSESGHLGKPSSDRLSFYVGVFNSAVDGETQDD